jgi:16S rRNA (guanine(1405)-N(7))-methyltransferase
MQDFYAYIFGRIDKSCTILDLACGLNPFVIPLVGIPPSVSYFAYDIHTPRIELIKQFFKGCEINGHAEVRDILLTPPQQSAAAAFLFKEAHRLEKRRKGTSRSLIRSINADFLFLSLPTHNLKGKFDLHEKMRRLVFESVEGSGAVIDSVDFQSETLFTIGLNNG